MQKAKLIQEILQKEFSKKAVLQGEVIKISVKSINSFGILCLYRLTMYHFCIIELKRSGSGITILATF